MQAPSTAHARISGVRAIILAAGRGTRLRPITATMPKCLTEVRGTPILVNAISCLEAVGVTEVTIVIGHHGEQIRERLGTGRGSMCFDYVQSDAFATTNNLYSLWLARERLRGDVLLIEGDVVFTEELLERLLDGPPCNLLATSARRPGMHGTLARVDDDGRVSALVTGGAGPLDGSSQHKTVNVCLLRDAFVREQLQPGLRRRVDAGDTNSFYEAVFEELIAAGRAEFEAIDCSDLAWAEIDSVADLRAAELRLAPAAERYELVRRSHGGYWRFHFADHAYLYNLWFPPEELLAALRRRLDALVQHYPLGHAELAELMAVVCAQPPERLVVGNGAAELIKALAGLSAATDMVVAVPTFNEYERAWPAHGVHRVAMQPPRFALDAERVVACAREHDAALAVIVSPNNPTAQTVPRADLLALARALDELDCRLLVDDSFLAFARDGRRDSVADALAEQPNLAVIHSLSKIYGIAGLRLGYLASADLEFVARVRERLPIWSVNSLACALLELLPEHREAFGRSCARVRAASEQLFGELDAIPGLAALRPDANFVLCRVPDHAPDAEAITRALFCEHDILIKSCAGKTMADADRYLRIAARTPAENTRLAAALRELLARPRAGAS